MEHPDTGRLQALLDGEVVGSEARSLKSHIGTCGACKEEARALEAAAAAADALVLLDVEPRMEEAKQRMQARRRSGGRPATPRSHWRWVTLPRAASIALLLTGLTFSALPGSPVRRWLVEGWGALFHSASQVPVETEATTEQGPEPGSFVENPPESGAGIPVLSGEVEIQIEEMASDAELIIRWTDGEEAWIFAGEGTRFNTVAGRLEATAPPGDVRIEIPRNADEVTLRVNGEILLRKTNGEVQVRGNVRDRSASEIRFGPSGGTNGGPPGGV